MAANGYHAQVKMLGIPDIVIEHGTVKQLQKDAGYDTAAIVNAIREMMKASLQVTSL